MPGQLHDRTPDARARHRRRGPRQEEHHHSPGPDRHPGSGRVDRDFVALAPSRTWSQTSRTWSAGRESSMSRSSWTPVPLHDRLVRLAVHGDSTRRGRNEHGLEQRDRTGPPLRRRVAMHVTPSDRSAGCGPERGRHWLGRRCVRQRARGVDGRPVRDGGHQAPAAVEDAPESSSLLWGGAVGTTTVDYTVNQGTSHPPDAKPTIFKQSRNPSSQPSPDFFSEPERFRRRLDRDRIRSRPRNCSPVHRTLSGYCASSGA